MFIHDFGPIKIMNKHSSSKNKIIEYISSYLFTELFSHVLVTTIDNITNRDAAEPTADDRGGALAVNRTADFNKTAGVQDHGAIIPAAVQAS